MGLSEGCNSNWTYNVLQLNHITCIARIVVSLTYAYIFADRARLSARLRSCALVLQYNGTSGHTEASVAADPLIVTYTLHTLDGCARFPSRSRSSEIVSLCTLKNPFKWKTTKKKVSKRIIHKSTKQSCDSI